MAYVLKYKGDWTNPTTGYEYEILLYQDGASAGSKTIKVQEVSFRYELNDRIFTSSVDVTFLNDLGWDEFNDLLSNTEKEWYVKIRKYNDNNVQIFEGYIAVDIMERDFSNDIGSISFTATDYLRKLEEIYVENVTSGNNYSLREILADGLANVEEQTIYINSNLFYKDHDTAATDTMFEQSYLNADYFYKNNVETITYWDYIQSLLKATNSYLYIYNNAYYVERYNDVSTNTSWNYYSYTTGTGGSATSKFARYNKQDDFDYVNRSQKLEYVSGLSDFTLNVDPQEYISRLPNSWDIPLEIVTNLYLEDASINDEQWYINDFYETNFTPSQTTGTNDLGMANYIQYDTSVRYTGNAINFLVYKMPFTMNSGGSTRLQVKFKSWVQVGLSSEEDDEFISQMYIRNSNDSPDANYYYKPVDDDDNASEGEMSPFRWNWKLKGNRTTGSNLVEFSKTYDIGIPTVKSSFNTNDKILLFFHPPYLYRNETRYYPDMTTFGDFEVKVLTENIDNQFIYDVNDGFINKESVDLDMYDFSNLNIKNGFYLSDGTKTVDALGWTDDGGSTYDSIINHYVKSETGFFYKTREVLNAQLKFKGETILKPLSFLNDEKIVGKDFLVRDYTWNMLNGIYTIKAEEYSSDKGEINII